MLTERLFLWMGAICQDKDMCVPIGKNEVPERTLFNGIFSL